MTFFIFYASQPAVWMVWYKFKAQSWIPFLGHLKHCQSGKRLETCTTIRIYRYWTWTKFSKRHWQRNRIKTSQLPTRQSHQFLQMSEWHGCQETFSNLGPTCNYKKEWMNWLYILNHVLCFILSWSWFKAVAPSNKWLNHFFLTLP